MDTTTSPMPDRNSATKIVASLTILLATVMMTPGVLATAPQEPERNVASSDWTSWRGPQQNGTSLEENLPNRVAVDGPSTWSFRLAGRGTPVIANGRLFAMGYEGEGKNLEEIIVCLDAKTGAKIWEHRFKDFLTDIIYYRFAIGSPTVDVETGNVYCLTTAGLFCGFTRDGKMLWQHSMMSEYGRLTFPNGRTGAPLIDGDLAIVHVITSGWGKQAPARDRFFAFEKRTGESVWSSTPGGPPKDSSFCYPVLATENGRRILYAGLGGGHLVAVDVRTGDPLWRYQMAIGGINSSPLLFEDSIIAIHGKENLDTSTIGRMVSVKRGALPDAPKAGAKVLDKSWENWRNDLEAFTSSPVLVDNRIFQTVLTGDLYCIDANSGTTLWHKKLAPDQIHASPAAGDGKLYVPMNNGSFHILVPSDAGPNLVQSVQLEGNCLGAPAIAGGRVYVHTTNRLYAFADASPDANTATAPNAAGPPVRLQIRPGDIVLRQSDAAQFRVRSLDALGSVVDADVSDVIWNDVPAGLDIKSSGAAKVDAQAPGSAGTLKATSGTLTGTARVRILPRGSFALNFDETPLRPHPKEEGVHFAFPPPWWVGAKLKWEVREVDGEKMLAKTIDRALFQRTMTIIGHPKMSNYTAKVDIRSDGNRRSMSTAGLVNQRYLFRLKGNHQQLEVSSNMELLRESVKFRWRPKRWYTLETRVDMEDDGTAILRARAWERGTEAPKDWLLEVRHPKGHRHGAAGIYGFTPQSRFRVYLDNLSVTSND